MADSHADKHETRSKTLQVSRDARYRILASKRRRRALDAMLGLQPPIALEDLAAEIAAKAGDEQRLDEVEISLHHNHLPLLDQFDVVEYDRDRNRVTKHRADQLDG